jgi:hypothetical protein
MIYVAIRIKADIHISSTDIDMYKRLKMLIHIMRKRAAELCMKRTDVGYTREQPTLACE